MKVNSLKHKTEQNQHPHPIGSAETGAIKEREGGEEGTAEGNEGREGKFPLAARGVDNELTLLLGLSEAEDEGIGSLDEEQEDEDASQQAHQEPPVGLQYFVGYHGM